MGQEWTVKQVARLSGVSVRTLHHYDAIGLLKPARVGENGYRLYRREELLRLQQILFHRELEFPLEAIAAVLKAPDFDRIAALRGHRAKLEAQARRYDRLLATLDRTLADLEQEREMDANKLYEGFAPEKQGEYEAWLVDRYGGDMAARIEASKAAVKGWTRADYDAVKAEGDAVNAGLAKAMADGLPADSAAAQALVARHHAWVGRFWTPDATAYSGLADMYQEHPGFRAHYDKVAEGLVDYLAEGMRVFAKTV
ncbi:MerR family transcriptional regulator [Caulobacter mirabilis]|uniref:Transcriptional regulator n=1 Tax=Caulobacter mirabilis TaxID=69666 RepID=A0A2D2B211_9CAUL|nr:MerR family transcriptional regulator [Caulobacter mirabilis]ATQ44299.1 transcriptional regulator [Caulobacter mirabilis]